MFSISACSRLKRGNEKDGIDYRKEFSSWWKGEWKSSVKFPQKGSVFDYYVD